MEKIHIITGTAGRTITMTGLEYDAVSKDNILGVINMTQSEPLYTPMDLNNITDVTYSSGTLTITLASSVPAIVAGDKLYIKFYFDAGDSPEDPYSKALAEFFGVTLLQGYEFMTDTEVTDELEDIMQALDPELLQEVEYPEGSGTYMTKAQAITAQAMQIINPSQS